MFTFITDTRTDSNKYDIPLNMSQPSNLLDSKKIMKKKYIDNSHNSWSAMAW
jgi:hypothetical protein